MQTKYVLATEDGTLLYTPTMTPYQYQLAGSGGHTTNSSVVVYDSAEKAVEAARTWSKTVSYSIYVCKVVPTHLIKPALPGDVVELSVNSTGPYR